MDDGFHTILSKLPDYERQLVGLSDTVLANLVMISEIPAPTFSEQERVEFILNRMSEYGLQNASTDEVGNALGVLPGTSGDKNILIVAHLDTNVEKIVDHTITVQTNKVIGPGVADNGLGLAVMTSLPAILEHLDIKLESNLVLMGSSRSLGRGDIEGLRFFLSNTELPFSAGICVEGVKLGRISYSSIGMMRCEISYSIPEEYDWTQFGAVGSIVVINDVINHILEIPIPRRPRTNIMLGSIRGGTGYGKLATNASLRFEIRSESAEMVLSLRDQIEHIVAEVSSNTGAEISFDVFARRRPGGIPFTHPLAKNTTEIIRSLDIKPRISPSTSELSAFIDREIPALTVGITDGENIGLPGELVYIDPIYKGISQLLGIILATDGGYCDETE
ncbi:MAG: peptidase [Spirochaetales bacterium]|nr:peptidase [Spirochaetales bacterium]